jgi:hypothetical protein
LEDFCGNHNKKTASIMVTLLLQSIADSGRPPLPVLQSIAGLGWLATPLLQSIANPDWAAPPASAIDCGHSSASLGGWGEVAGAWRFWLAEKGAWLRRGPG